MTDHQGYRRVFAIVLIVLQAIAVILFGIFVRTGTHTDAQLNANYYPMYQDVNVMMLIGFGFLMTFLRSHSWSALAYTFFINAIIVQYYILFSSFWARAFHNQWGKQIGINEHQLTAGLYCVAAVLISFGGVIGRVGPLQLLVMAIIQAFGYALNQKITYEQLKIYDVGGSTAIHTFGAYFGLTVCFILGRSQSNKPVGDNKPTSSYNSNIFAFIGTLFLWMYWPSFNAGYFPTTGMEKSVIIVNTVLSLTGSCLSTFLMSAFLREKFSLEDILNATLAGGVAIGASCGILVNPAGSILIGVVSGMVSTLGFRFLTAKLEDFIGLYDTCGIHNLHGIPGVLGGIFSGIIIGAFNSVPIQDQTEIAELKFYNQIGASGRSFIQQGGFQVAATFTSLAIGIAFGILAGILVKWITILTPKQFYKDRIYFQVPQQSEQGAKNSHFKTLDSSMISNNFKPMDSSMIQMHVKPKESQMKPIVQTEEN